MITIRKATLDDERLILDLAARFIAEEHNYRSVLSFDAETLADTLRQVLRVGFVFLARDHTIADPETQEPGHDRIVGMLAAVALQSLTSTDRYLDEVVWYVEPEARRTRAGVYLLRAAVAQAQAEGCNSCKMVAPAGSTVGAFLERNGFQAVETAYLLRIEDGRLQLTRAGHARRNAAADRGAGTVRPDNP